MAEGWRASKILCPYFRSEDRQKHKIICEGLGDARSMSWNFDNRDERQRIRQMEIFCQNHYERCEVYRMIHSSKYEED